jgi:dienelactone hydrolase
MRRGALVAAWLSLALCAQASAGASTRTITYTAATPDGSLTLPATFVVPPGATPAPAVVVLHGSGGVDGRGAYHAEALHRLGIATLEVDMWTPRGFKGGPQSRPRRLRETYPDAFGALRFLAQQPEIDPQRIGIMGFSWGGGLALATASAGLVQEFTGGALRFAAHAPFYPVCWSFLKTAADFKLTGAPVRIFAGERDDYEEPDTCRTLVERLPPESRPSVMLTIYPGATHAWDTRSGAVNFFDPNAALGKGGRVRFFPDGKLADRSRREAAAFFADALAVTPPTKP